MIPGEIISPAGAPALEANTGLATLALDVTNTGDRPHPGRFALSFLRNQ